MQVCIDIAESSLSIFPFRGLPVFGMKRIINFDERMPTYLQEKAIGLIKALGFKIDSNERFFQTEKINMSDLIDQLLLFIKSGTRHVPVDKYILIFDFLYTNKLYYKESSKRSKKYPMHIKMSLANDVSFYKFTGLDFTSKKLNEMLWVGFGGKEIKYLPTLDEIKEYQRKSKNGPVLYRRGRGLTRCGYRIFEVMEPEGRYVAIFKSKEDCDLVCDGSRPGWIDYDGAVHPGFYVRSKKDVLSLIKLIQAKDTK